ncbi:30S ribosomal protein S10, putative [Theileria equi strain WA]|uniref:30S ribosomal protein S10, putative n=1 Tax=Theileria equi strain WA TaxID=1537102 RepID=L0B2H0_THEEQ|nr:30S ribosomal protein S10, putative [Theileria equi strain WA]AFZ81693.1 30S ribosomal protein S10, putative [Theileria equi strain WA]|eukprot:XP_004831359.1 30S ribosomal protein S10, putative [Theileria equi strain WA]
MVSLVFFLCLIQSTWCVTYQFQHHLVNKAILIQKSPNEYNWFKVTNDRVISRFKGIYCAHISQSFDNTRSYGLYTFLTSCGRRCNTIENANILCSDFIDSPKKPRFYNSFFQSNIQNGSTSKNMSRFAPSELVNAPIKLAKIVGEKVVQMLRPGTSSPDNTNISSPHIGNKSDGNIPYKIKEGEYGPTRSTLKKPYFIRKSDPGLPFKKWPKNSFLRIKLTSYNKQLLKAAIDNIKIGIEKHSNLQVMSPMAIPMRRKRWCYLSSPHIDKRSKDLIEIQRHVRILDVLPPKNLDIKDTKFSGLMMVPLPNLVSFDYWFEDVHKPIKNSKIHNLFKRRTWVSKYYLYNRDKTKKEELIRKLIAPELENEIPLKWKRRMCDYFGMQLGELQKLYIFVSRRKAEDNARLKYNVPMPDYHDFGEIRFVGNEEDRAFDGDEIKDTLEPLSDDEY